jgi:hypothetical protein
MRLFLVILVISTVGCASDIFTRRTTNDQLLSLKEKNPPNKDELLLDDLIGLSEECAVLLIESYRIQARITSRDGYICDGIVDDEDYYDNYQPNRINLDSVDGAVFYANRG